tara:strand:+ start:687 stop:1241 length:555 start_codon:yes stop_codon:yes gene_type:complete
MKKEIFSIGDKVIFIDELKKGLVVGFKNNKTLIVQCDDINFEVNISEVIKFTEESRIFYNKIKTLPEIQKIENFTFDEIISETRNTDFKVRLSKDFELDLHIEKIIDNFFDLSGSEILDFQMNVFYKAIFEAYRLKLPFIIIIHGLGKGVLKSKITDFLKENSASFCDESPMIYKGGATRIYLY